MSEGQVTEKRKSNVGLLETGEQEITAENIRNLEDVDDQDAAEIYDNRLIVLTRDAKRAFIETGMICLEMTRRGVWTKLIDPATREPFHSRDSWIMARMGVSRASAYDAMKALRGAASVEDLREMPRRNAVRLSKLSSTVQADPIIIAAAKGSEKGFVAKVRQEYPDQHIEATRAIIAPELSARELIDKCFAVVCWAYDVTSREDVMEQLCVYFMDGWCEREGYSGLKNEEAYVARK
jgi:hypothetical protein